MLNVSQQVIEDRLPCSVAIVDDRCEILFHSSIKPTEKVVSDLFPLSDVRMKDLDQAPRSSSVNLSIVQFIDNYCWTKSSK